MHVYTDGEDWWVAESMSDFLRMYEEECGQPHDMHHLLEMPDDEPLTMRLDPDMDERCQVGEPALVTKPAGEWARESFAKHKSGGLIGTVNL